MTKWTQQQQDAINKTGSNIIVSAGAGSGKTAVLTERVITKIKNGTNINELLILTFTNNAAHEMKERIRNEISKIPQLKEQLDYIDSSYITTFDSYSMTLVKKYGYLLNLSKNINIIDSNICKNLTVKYLDEIFDELYEENNLDFLKLINDLTFKSDDLLKENIILVNETLNKLINKKEYLKNYIDNFYTNESINELKNRYIDLIKEEIDKVKEIYNNMSYLTDEKYYDKLTSSFDNLFSSKTYDEIITNIDINLPRLPNKSSDELKEAKEELNKYLDNIKKYTIYKNEAFMKDIINSTKVYVKVLINIINKLDKKMQDFKYENNVFEFNDIALLAIKIVKENESVKEEIKNSFKEIMLDEYQDTSDIQEELINLISNNNVYMVGDIKQSIYRFRNANPIIFKEKYDNYSNNIGGIKIDLLSNFRSREEVVNDINNIFNNLMTESLGGTDYIKSHQMIFGNKAYTQNKTNQNYNLEIFNYEINDSKYIKSEYEAFIIASDIKKKLQSKIKVYDKNIDSLRDITYRDFCILLDRGKDFDLYKKIFEYLEVPLNIINDEKITEDNDLLVIKNIIDLVVKIYKKEYDYKIKYDLYSIYRSFLFDYKDSDYFNNVIINNYYVDPVYKKCEYIASNLENMNNRELIETIIDTFDYYDRLIRIGNIKKNIVKLNYLLELADSLSNIGYSVIDFNDYFNEMINNKLDIKISFNNDTSNSVKLMNIHKSKGLEFPYCYYAGLDNKFNIQELKEQILFDKELGFILPFYDENNGIGNIFTKELYKNKYLDEDISERVRLFYVALTRAKEKMIIVTNDIHNSKSDNLNSFKSFLSRIITNIENSIVDIKVDNITKGYKNIKDININFESKNEVKLNVKEIKIENNILDKKHSSIIIDNIVTKEEHDLLETGTKIHNILEYTSFDTDNKYINNIKNKIPNLKEAKIYKELELYEVIDKNVYNGIIDLMIEYKNEIYIIDYKLKNIDKKEYINQLITYKKVIGSRTNKTIRTFLYSILDDELREIEIHI